MLWRYLLFLILSELVKLIIKHLVLYFSEMSLVSQAKSCKVADNRQSDCMLFLSVLIAVRDSEGTQTHHEMFSQKIIIKPLL